MYRSGRNVVGIVAITDRNCATVDWARDDWGPAQGTGLSRAIGVDEGRREMVDGEY
jgi:hypothetical protein